MKEWLFRLPGEWLDDLEEDIEDRLSMLASIKPDLNADDVRSCSKETDFEAIKNEVIEEDPLSLEPAKFSQGLFVDFKRYICGYLLLFYIFHGSCF